jgi:hypothetical protein
MNKDRFGNTIHDGDIVFYTTGASYANERIGKVFFQEKGRLGMMSGQCVKGADKPVGSNERQAFDLLFKPKKSWYHSGTAIVVNSLIPQLIIDRLDEAYSDWRKKNGDKEF